jgi:hypothetical protein
MMIELCVGVGDGGAIDGSIFGFGHAGRVDEGAGVEVWEGAGVWVGREVLDGAGVVVTLGELVGVGLTVGVTGAELVVADGLVVRVACEL